MRHTTSRNRGRTTRQATRVLVAHKGTVPDTSTPQRTCRRSLRQLALCVTVTVVGLVLPAAPTQAHATVVTVSPAAASELSASPRRITVRFNEPVTADAKRVQLLDALGKVVPVAYSAEGSGALQVLTPTRPLRSGLYALRWSVVSDDGHVVTGASTFTVKSRAPAGGRRCSR